MSVPLVPEKIIADPQVPGVSNPDPGRIHVVVMVPEKVTIKMVDASALGDYEYHGGLSAALLAVFVGFLVPTIQELRGATNLAVPFLIITLFFLILFACSTWMTLAKRSVVRKGGKEIQLQTTGAQVG